MEVQSKAGHIRRVACTRRGTNQAHLPEWPCVSFSPQKPAVQSGTLFYSRRFWLRSQSCSCAGASRTSFVLTARYSRGRDGTSFLRSTQGKPSLISLVIVSYSGPSGHVSKFQPLGACSKTSLQNNSASSAERSQCCGLNFMCERCV